MQVGLISIVLASLLFQASPPPAATDAGGKGTQVLRLPAAPDDTAYTKITAERNLEPKKKLMLGFLQNFPKSKHLAEVYIELSRALVGESDFTGAQQYADKAISTVARMKTDASKSDEYDAAWHAWLNTLDKSANSNLSWVKQMAAWQQQQLRSHMIPKK